MRFSIPGPYWSTSAGIPLRNPTSAPISNTAATAEMTFVGVASGTAGVWPASAGTANEQRRTTLGRDPETKGNFAGYS